MNVPWTDSIYLAFLVPKPDFGFINHRDGRGENGERHLVTNITSLRKTHVAKLTSFW